jgi:rod shape-determining protein MreC
MFAVVRWWRQHAVKALLVGLVLVGAWGMRQTQAGLLVELYQTVTRPLQLRPTPQERITSARIQELQARVAELESQNQKLEKLLAFAQNQSNATIAAPIIGRSADRWWQQLTLGAGRSDGIEAGDTVKGYGGLVGRIIAVTPHTSRVRLVSDPESQVGTTISRSRHMGVLQGQGADRAVMRFFDKRPDVKSGDVVVTSQASRLFPPGIPLGKVRSVTEQGKAVPSAQVELTAPIRNLEWGFVKPFDPASNDAAS